MKDKNLKKLGDSNRLPGFLKLFLVFIAICLTLSIFTTPANLNKTYKVIRAFSNILMIILTYYFFKFGCKKVKQSDLINWRKKNIALITIGCILIILSSLSILKYSLPFILVGYFLIVIRVYKMKLYIHDGIVVGSPKRPFWMKD